MRISILASGGGTNVQAILDHFSERQARAAGTVVLVASNRADAGALVHARRAGIEASVLADPAHASALLNLLHSVNTDLLVLAGYLKLVPRDVVHAFAGRMLNVHPALLPAFGGNGMYGHRVHAAVIASCAKVSGVTVHWVDEEFDRGAIVAQWPVPVLLNDSPATLAERVLRVEHHLYPAVIEAVAQGAITMGADGRTVGTLPAHSAFATNDATLFFR